MWHLGHLSPELLLAVAAAAGVAGTAPLEYYFLHLLRPMVWGKLLPLPEPQFLIWNKQRKDLVW